MATEAKQAKHELRQQIKQSLSVLDERTVLDQSRRAQNVILQTPQYQNAKRVAIYLSMPSGEAQTSTLLIDAMRNEKRVYVPYIYKVGAKPRQNVMDMMRIETLAEYGELGRDSWGIPTLSPEGLDERGNAMGGKGLSFSLDGKCVMSEEDVDAGGLDLIIVPGVAFDRQMNRIGHGAGFYDKFLTRFVGDGKRKKPYLSEFSRTWPRPAA
jgi:5-formyltetrahydrofolate cyclo-ligase